MPGRGVAQPFLRGTIPPISSARPKVTTKKAIAQPVRRDSSSPAQKGATRSSQVPPSDPRHRETFDKIWLDLSTEPGKCRFADTGLGWKPTEGDTFIKDKKDIASGQWSRAAKGYEVKLLTRDGEVYQLDGFAEDDFERVQKVFKQWYEVPFDRRDHNIRGWNWGKTDFGKAELAFNVQSRPAFEIPYTEISNTNLAGKNEVVVEMSLPANGEETGTNGHLAGARAKGRRAGGARDQLVEMRFYIPGTSTKKEKKEKVKSEENGEVEEEEEEDDDNEQQNAAQMFYETLNEKAELGEVSGDTFATFLDVLHLTPRGRFDIDLYETSLRLRGKTYDYKIQYESIKKFMLLPKPDDVHTLLVLGLEPPLRQGQTRYPFLVMQFNREEEVSIDLNITDELLEEKYKGKLQSHYESPTYNVVATILKGLSGKKCITPSKDYSSHHQQSGVKCSIKANEGHLFLLDRSFMFVPKPATYISIENIQSITMSRVGGNMAASRTFDISVLMKRDGGEYQFSNINRQRHREEQQTLEDFFKIKGIRVKNEMTEDSGSLLAAAAALDADDDSEEEVGAARGSADEDDESVDEDFQADSDSDPAEEYDSNADSSGGESDAEMEDADGDANAADDDEQQRPKKKSKKV